MLPLVTSSAFSRSLRGELAIITTSSTIFGELAGIIGELPPLSLPSNKNNNHEQAELKAITKSISLFPCCLTRISRWCLHASRTLILMITNISQWKRLMTSIAINIVARRICLKAKYLWLIFTKKLLMESKSLEPRNQCYNSGMLYLHVAYSPNAGILVMYVLYEQSIAR